MKSITGILQILSIAFMWVFFVAISIWIINLILVSHKLGDALDASVAISIVAIPLFLTLASVLTYVFVGLRRGRARPQEHATSEGVASEERENS